MGSKTLKHNFSSKKDTSELTYKPEIHPQTWKTNLGLPKGKGGVGEEIN